MKCMPPRYKIHGFTLIELLVVVAIICLLAAILFPVFTTVREKARQSACASNLKQIGLSIIQYLQDNDETYPMAVQDNWCDPAKITQANCSGVEPVPMPVALNPYIKDTQIWKCPDSIGRKNFQYDYGYAAYLGLQVYGVTPGIPSTSVLSSNVSPSTLIMASDLIDPVVNGVWASGTSNPSTWVEYGRSFGLGDDATLCPPGSGQLAGLSNKWTSPGEVLYSCQQAWPAPWHTGMCNFLYTDGHVKLRNVSFEISHDVFGDPLCEWCNGH